MPGELADPRQSPWLLLSGHQRELRFFLKAFKLSHTDGALCLLGSCMPLQKTRACLCVGVAMGVLKKKQIKEQIKRKNIGL